MGFPFKPPKPQPRRWLAVLITSGVLLLVAVNASVWAAYYFRQLPGMVAPPLKTANTRAHALLTEIIVTDLRGDEPRDYRAASFPPPLMRVSPYYNSRRKTPPPPGALFHLRCTYDDRTRSEIAVKRNGKQFVVLCGDDSRPAPAGLIDFLDSAWAMDIVADLRSYDPDEFARGLARREERGDELTQELLDQLKKYDVFGGDVVPRLKHLLRPTRGAPLKIGPDMLGFRFGAEPRAAAVQKGLFAYLRHCHSVAENDPEGAGYAWVEYRPACDLLFWIADRQGEEDVADLLAASPNWTLLELSRRLAGMPREADGERDFCPTGETEESQKRFARSEQARVKKATQAWLAERDKLAAMTLDDRLEYVVAAWDEELRRQPDDFQGGSANWIRPDAWLRMIRLGEDVKPHAVYQLRWTSSLIDRALWHAVAVHFGEKVDDKLIAELIAAPFNPRHPNAPEKRMAKLVLRAARVTDIDVKYPDLRNVELQ